MARRIFYSQDDGQKDGKPPMRKATRLVKIGGVDQVEKVEIQTRLKKRLSSGCCGGGGVVVLMVIVEIQETLETWKF